MLLICGWCYPPGDRRTYSSRLGNAHKSLRCGRSESCIPKIRSLGVENSEIFYTNFKQENLNKWMVSPSRTIDIKLIACVEMNMI
mmetsp:Transcript_9452/g.23207  ORF Transcript_9452/g.23207 Transcript_9452/m.23207 type:complete len:85 (+) Transcript_9452:273-527(+)